MLIHPAIQGVYPATKYHDKNNPRRFLNYLRNRIDDLMLYGENNAHTLGLLNQSPPKELILQACIRYLIQMSNHRISNFLGGAVATQILCSVCAFRNNTLHCSFQPVSKRWELQMPQHHGG